MCAIIIAAWEKKVPVVTSLAITPGGAASRSNIGWDHLNALTISQETEEPSNADVGMLKLFSQDVHYLLNLGSTLSYVTPFLVVHLGLVQRVYQFHFLFLPRSASL